MNNIFRVIVAVILAAAVIGCADVRGEDTVPLRVMTFNIRYNTPNDGENAWPNRKDMAAGMILFHNADIVGIQEGLRGQVDDLAERLPGYGWIGIGRDDGKNAGEFMAVFYRRDRLELLDQSTFWLSETPEKPGIGWDAACNRVVTWGRFKDVRTGEKFYHFNTHFDHRGQIARRESAKLLIEAISEIAGSEPLAVTGDFNARPGSEPIGIITQGMPGISGSAEKKLTDSGSVSLHGHHGPSGTWTGFKSAGSPGDEPIDYIFIKNGVRVLRHGTLSDSFDGRFPTDHMPVLAEIIVE
ncbi:endonuclease/exonuclease/phosphatase family protein [Candidatus Latescibacterota bacterium]